MSSSLLAIRASSEANSADQKRVAEKRRNLLVIIYHHLIENGYIEAAERLQHETGTAIKNFEIADNVDLGLILSDYEAYYEMRFDKKPKLIRKLKDGEESKIKPPRQPDASSSSKKSRERNGSISNNNNSNNNSGKLPNVTGISNNNNIPSTTSISQKTSTIDEDQSINNMGINGIGVGGSSIDTSFNNKSGHKKNIEAGDPFEERVLKPPPHYSGDSEMRALASVISHEIYQESPNVYFDDIIELDDAKRILREAVQLPLQYPILFTGILKPWKGILLHGKYMLAFEIMCYYDKLVIKTFCIKVTSL